MKPGTKRSHLVKVARTDVSGGCSLGCAGIFLLAGLAWPMLHLLGGSKEPEIFVIPFFIGLPAFAFSHHFANRAVQHSRESNSLGAITLKVLKWSIIAVVILFAIGAVMDSLSRR